MTETFTRHPETTERRILDGVDFYKLPMGQVQFAKHRDDEVTFTMQNRDPERLLSEYVDIDELRERCADIQEKGFSPEEIAYLASLPASEGRGQFDEAYLDFLADLQLPDVDIGTDPETGELAVSAKGPWAAVSLWETVILSEVNELYFKGYAEKNGLTLEELYAEGDRRLDEKIAILRTRPDIKFADFGTRRRFSSTWHQHVIERLASELPNNFTGTSNPWFAYRHGLKPIGTFAHEMMMVYAALAEQEGRDPLEGHGEMLDDWQEMNPNLGIALTDTFTTDFFFADFGGERARKWDGYRHDSGDPIEFGHKTIRFLKAHGIDPKEKTIVFSDGLDVETMIKIADEFQDSIRHPYGWGTDATNDLGVKALQIVMKATRVNSIDTVKLSDIEGKHTGPQNKVDDYMRRVKARLAVETTFRTMADAV